MLPSVTASLPFPINLSAVIISPRPYPLAPLLQPTGYRKIMMNLDIIRKRLVNALSRTGACPSAVLHVSVSRPCRTNAACFGLGTAGEPRLCLCVFAYLVCLLTLALIVAWCRPL